MLEHVYICTELEQRCPRVYRPWLPRFAMQMFFLCVHTGCPSSSTVFANTIAFSLPLIRACRSLAGLELIQVPSTDGQISLILVHAPLEPLHFVSANCRTLLLLLGGILICLLCFLSLLRGCGLLHWSAASATKETADGMTDGGADCYTAAH